MLSRAEKDSIWSSLKKALAISAADATVSEIEREFRRQKIRDQERNGIGKPHRTGVDRKVK